jgi:hypothetical protein
MTTPRMGADSNLPGAFGGPDRELGVPSVDLRYFGLPDDQAPNNADAL